MKKLYKGKFFGPCRPSDFVDSEIQVGDHLFLGGCGHHDGDVMVWLVLLPTLRWAAVEEQGSPCEEGSEGTQYVLGMMNPEAEIRISAKRGVTLARGDFEPLTEEEYAFLLQFGWEREN